MKKVAYFMHVDWGWIKQRPHFIAEELDKKYDVTVITKTNYQVKKLKNSTNLNLKKLYRLPFERFYSIRLINSLLYLLQLVIIVNKNDIIWFTSPELFRKFLKKKFPEKIFIYDCMDDILEFSVIQANKSFCSELQKKEHELYEYSDYVLSSAEYLKQKLIARYHQREVIVVNNAIKSIRELPTEFDRTSTISFFENSEGYIKMVYIGTISSWFNFPLMKKITDIYGNIQIYLFGPKEVNIPNIERLNYCGVVEHDAVFPIMANADILCMPFIVNELIRSVNPVKLYEYIYSGKPCLAPEYGESLKFEDFVYLYKDEIDCLSLIKKILSNKEIASKQSLISCHKFCQMNTWENRGKQIFDLLAE